MTKGLTKAQIERIPKTLKMTYFEMRPKDRKLLEKAADAGLLERFWNDPMFGKLFTRYRITPAGRAALTSQEKTDG